MGGPGHIPCSVMVGSGTYCLHPAGVRGSQFTMTLPCPVDGIFANLGNREWGPSPLSFFVDCEYLIHRVMVNWDLPHFPGYTPAWWNPKR